MIIVVFSREKNGIKAKRQLRHSFLVFSLVVESKQPQEINVELFLSDISSLPEQPQEEISIKQKLIEGWIRTRGKKRTEMHISHLIHCVARSAFEILDDTPPPPDERKL